jgi:hypothetical protein
MNSYQFELQKTKKRTFPSSKKCSAFYHFINGYALGLEVQASEYIPGGMFIEQITEQQLTRLEVALKLNGFKFITIDL